MKPQFHHQLVTSFVLWLEHIILCKGEAFQNKTTNLYYQSDYRLDDNYLAFASPYKQWVTDTAIERKHNSTIIDGITLDGFYIKRGAQGIKYDFDNGRVLIPKTLASSASTVQASYSVKDFNTYITDQTEEELLIETKFDKNSRFDQDVSSGIKPYDQVVPAIFVSYEGSRNVPFAFGGEDTTETQIRCVVFAEDSYQLDGVFSILNDLNYSNFANVGFNEHPLNEFGDLKNGIYDYEDLTNRYFNYSNFAYIDRIQVSKLNDRVAKKAHPGLFMGFIDIDIKANRFPRQELVEPTTTIAPMAGYLPLPPYQVTLTITQKPLPPYNISLNNRVPYAPYDLFLSTIKHIRLAAGNVASVAMTVNSELLIKLDGTPGQIAFLSILGQTIQVGHSASGKLVWDGYTFSNIGETIQKTINGVIFDITWYAKGSQIIKLKRAGGSTTYEVDVAIYVPC